LNPFSYLPTPWDFRSAFIVASASVIGISTIIFGILAIAHAISAIYAAYGYRNRIDGYSSADVDTKVRNSLWCIAWMAACVAMLIGMEIIYV